MKRIIIILLNTIVLALIVYMLIDKGMPSRYDDLLLIGFLLIVSIINIWYILLPKRKELSFQVSKALRLTILAVGVLLVTVSVCKAFGIVHSYSEMTSMFQRSVNKKIREGTPLTMKEKRIIMMPANMGLGLVKIQSFAFIACFLGCLMICISQYLYYREKSEREKNSEPKNSQDSLQSP